jgi:hypothetical protein
MLYFIWIKLMVSEVGLGRRWDRFEIGELCSRHSLISNVVYQNNFLHMRLERFLT